MKRKSYDELFIFRFGTRTTCMAGSVIAGFAIFSSSFSPTLFVLILTYGVLGGIGLGLM